MALSVGNRLDLKDLKLSQQQHGVRESLHGRSAAKCCIAVCIPVMARADVDGPASTGY